MDFLKNEKNENQFFKMKILKNENQNLTFEYGLKFSKACFLFVLGRTQTWADMHSQCTCNADLNSGLHVDPGSVLTLVDLGWWWNLYHTDSSRQFADEKNMKQFLVSWRSGLIKT